MNTRTSGLILAVIATGLIACGTPQAASTSSGRIEPASGDAFLTADEIYGVQGATYVGDVQGLPSTLGQPALQP